MKINEIAKNANSSALVFASSENYSNLQFFYLGDNKVTDHGAVPLIESKYFPQLKVLDLAMNKLGEATMISALKVNRKGKIQVIYR